MIGPITPEERAERARAAFDYVGADVAALVLFDDQFIQYYTDFIFHPTERPVALIISREGERTLFVPELEREHAAQAGQLEHVVTYPEYPGKEHPLELLCKHLNTQGFAGRTLGVDYDGYPPVMGYTGPLLSERLHIKRISAALDQQLSLKSPHEIALIRESARWGHRAHELLQAYTAPGKTETEVEGQATREATEEMTAALGPNFKSRNRWLGGAVALYRGQVGVNSALPHAVNINATFAVGDTLVTGAGAGVYGYLSELERTMFIGEPSAEQRGYFEHMLNLQDLAFEQMRPGATCASVDEAVRGYYERENLTAFWRHHVGATDSREPVFGRWGQDDTRARYGAKRRARNLRSWFGRFSAQRHGSDYSNRSGKVDDLSFRCTQPDDLNAGLKIQGDQTRSLFSGYGLRCSLGTAADFRSRERSQSFAVLSAGFLRQR